jgi:hypothetical protein
LNYVPVGVLGSRHFSSRRFATIPLPVEAKLKGTNIDN